MPTTIWRDSTPATRTSTAGSAATPSPPTDELSSKVRRDPRWPGRGLLQPDHGVGAPPAHASQARAGSAGLYGRDGAPRPARSRSQRAGPRFRSNAPSRSPTQGRRRWRSGSSASRSRRRRRRTSRPILRTSWLRSGARSRAAVVQEDEGPRNKPRGAGMTVPYRKMSWGGSPEQLTDRLGEGRRESCIPKARLAYTAGDEADSTRIRRAPTITSGLGVGGDHGRRSRRHVAVAEPFRRWLGRCR